MCVQPAVSSQLSRTRRSPKIPRQELGARPGSRESQTTDGKRQTHLADRLALAMLRKRRRLALALPIPTRGFPLALRRLAHDVPNLALVDADTAVRLLDERRVSGLALAFALALEVERGGKLVHPRARVLVARRQRHRVRAADVLQEPADLLFEVDKVHDAIRQVFCGAGGGQHGFAALLTALVRRHRVRSEHKAVQGPLLLVLRLLLAVLVPLLAQLRGDVLVLAPFYARACVRKV